MAAANLAAREISAHKTDNVKWEPRERTETEERYKKKMYNAKGLKRINM